MRRIPLVYVLLLLLVACVGYAWNSERQSKLKLEKEVASLHQAAAGVQRAKQASKVDEAAALKWLKSELNEFAWLIGKWRLESQEDFVPNWNLPGRPKVAFERHDVYTVGGVSDIEIRPVYDGTLRVTYTMFSWSRLS